MKTDFPAAYKRGKIYYFKYTGRNGRRYSKSTGQEKKSDAQRVIRAFMEQKKSGVSPEITLRSIIRLYQDPNTNPKKKEAFVTARNYSDRYAAHIATHAKELECESQSVFSLVGVNTFSSPYGVQENVFTPFWLIAPDPNNWEV